MCFLLFLRADAKTTLKISQEILSQYPVRAIIANPKRNAYKKCINLLYKLIIRKANIGLNHSIEPLSSDCKIIKQKLDEISMLKF